MLRSYMDESGSFGDPEIAAVSRGGVVLSTESSEAFEKEWKAILEEQNISWLHMKDFAHSQGEFKNWKGDKRRRDKFMGELMDVMYRHIEGYLAATMYIHHFNALTDEQKSRIGDNPYYPCFMACVISSAECARRLTPEDKIDIYFADAPGFKGKAHNFWMRCKSQHAPEDIRNRLGSIALDVSPKVVLPLQAADLIAYEVNNHLTKMYRTKEWPSERWPFSQVKKKMLLIEVFDKKTLKERFGF